MRPFWDAVVEPLLDAAAVRTVVEIGAERGQTTEVLLAWSARTGATVHSIDPSPRFAVARWQLEHGERFRFHRARSLDVLASIAGVDAAIVDGNHNWYTVISELRLLAGAARAAGRPCRWSSPTTRAGPTGGATCTTTRARSRTSTGTMPTAPAWRPGARRSAGRGSTRSSGTGRPRAARETAS